MSQPLGGEPEAVAKRIYLYVVVGACLYTLAVLLYVLS
jgi:hypothetical protein